MSGNIDRIEDGIIVIILEDGSFKYLDKNLFPDLKAGMCIDIKKDGSIKEDKEQTDKLKERVISLQHKVFTEKTCDEK